MIAFRIICWLAIITLSVAGLGWTVQQTPVPGATAPAEDAKTTQGMGTTTSLNGLFSSTTGTIRLSWSDSNASRPSGPNDRSW